jgi:hypothetical protein
MPLSGRALKSAVLWTFVPPILPYDFKVIFGEGYPAIFQRILIRQVAVFSKPWNWERLCSGLASAEKCGKTCSSTVS